MDSVSGGSATMDSGSAGAAGGAGIQANDYVNYAGQLARLAAQAAQGPAPSAGYIPPAGRMDFQPTAFAAMARLRR